MPVRGQARDFSKFTMTNLYETLGVTPGATEEEIEAAYARFSKFFEESQMHEISLAYKTLADKSSREEYDEYIA